MGLTLLLFAVTWLSPEEPETWPSHLADDRRSARVDASWRAPLQRAWTFHGQRPSPSWPAPAKGSYWQRLDEIQPRVVYDRTYQVVADQEAVYFGSSSTDQVRCLDLETGALRWSHFTEGPIRFAPILRGTDVLFGSDDGYVYCLDKRSGQELWRYRGAPRDRRIVGNGRLISAWPIRTGVVADEAVVYGSAGLFPTYGACLFAIDRETGKEIWRRELESLSPQGYLILSDDILYVPNGRSQPHAFDRRSGAPLGPVASAGGSYALLVDESLVSGPGNDGSLVAGQGGSRDRFATFRGRHMVVDGRRSYLHTDRELYALDRVAQREARARLDAARARLSAARKIESPTDEQIVATREFEDDVVRCEQDLLSCVLWRRACREPYALIMVGDVLYAGGEDVVSAYETSSGEKIWSAPLEGRVYGLAASAGMLIVSTDRGVIQAFSSNAVTVDASPTPLAEIAGDPSPTTIGDYIVEHAASKGFALVLGLDSGELVRELLHRTELTLVGADWDRARIDALRKAFGLRRELGPRLAFLHVSSGTLPMTSSFANVVTTERTDVIGPWGNEWSRVLRPEGGLAVLRESVGVSGGLRGMTRVGEDGISLTRAPLRGRGEWTHLYGTAGNSACSGEGNVSAELELQWFGGPGPRRMIDRHLRTTSPLVAGGRLFIPGEDRIVAVDLYNGTELWDTPLAGFRRVGIPYDCGSMCTDGSSVFAAAGARCFELSAVNGAVRGEISIPGQGAEWGYVARKENVLIGSAQEKGASRTTFSREEIDAQYRDHQASVVSTRLFALDASSKKTLWTFEGKTVLNTSICVEDGRVLFVAADVGTADVRAADVVNGDGRGGRVDLGTFMAADPKLYALDLNDGELAWSRSLSDTSPRHVLYLAAADGTGLLIGSSNREGKMGYSLQAFSLVQGKELWSRWHLNNASSIGGSHGEQVHHPVLVQGKVIAEPRAYELSSGEEWSPMGQPWWMGARRGCGTLSASEQCLYFRDHHPRARPLEGPAKHVSKVSRPGCWISMIPAGGLLALPEASSGCVCSFPLQTSMALIPVSR